MKIISNFKDYYDPMVDVFGFDPSVIYERSSQKLQLGKWVNFNQRKEEINSETLGNSSYQSSDKIDSKRLNIIPFAIAGQIYIQCIHEDKYVPFDEIEKVLKAQSPPTQYKYDLRPKTLLSAHLVETDINNEYDCPVILLGHERYPSDYSFKKGYLFFPNIINPNLSLYKFNSLIPADEIFVAITNFLTKEKPLIDSRTDLEKVISNGFDRKTSFRKM